MKTKWGASLETNVAHFVSTQVVHDDLVETPCGTRKLICNLCPLFATNELLRIKSEQVIETTRPVGNSLQIIERYTELRNK